MKTTSIILFVTLCMLFSCNQDKEKVSKTIQVDLKQEAEVSVFDIFERIELIPLETTKKSLINYIHKLDFFDGRFYIRDGKAMRLLTFDNKGNYISDVGNTGKGPGEFFNIGDFAINKFTNLVSIMSNTGTIYNYNFNSEFINTHQLNSDLSAFHKFFPINAEELILWSASTQTLFLYSLENQKITKILYEEKKENDFSGDVLYSYNEGVFFTRSMSNKVYKLNRDRNLETSYMWDFGIKNIDLTNINFPAETGTKNKQINKMFQDSEIPYVLTGQNQNKFCYYAKTRFNMEDYVNVFYFKKKGKQLVFKTFKEGVHFFPLYWTDDYVVGLNKVNNNMAVNKQILDEENLEKFDSLTEMSNPCLVKYYFKSDLPGLPLKN